MWNDVTVDTVEFKSKVREMIVFVDEQKAAV
jgi:hypothetical protein